MIADREGGIDIANRSDSVRPLAVVAYASDEIRTQLCERLTGICDVVTCTESDVLPFELVEQQPAILFLDSKLPPRERERYVQQLRADQDVAAMPLVSLEYANGEQAHAVGGLPRSPDAYLKWPFSTNELHTTVHTLAELAQLRRKTSQAVKRDHIIDNFGESFIAVNASWRVTYINAAAERYLGVKRKDILGRDAWGMFAIDPSRAQVYRRVMEERVPATYEGSTPEYGWFQIDAVPFDDGGIGVYFRNADRLKEAEAAAVASERRLRLFLEDAQDYALVLLDPQQRVLEWLGGAENITGWSSKEITGDSLEFMFSLEDVAAGQAAKEFHKAAETGRSEDRRWHLKKDGSRFFAEGVTTAFRDDSGVLQGFSKIFRDATSQKLAEEALKESQEKLELIVSSVADGIYSITVDGVCELVNPAGAAMLGYEPEELEGRSLHDVVHHHRADGTAYPANECRISMAMREGVSLRVDDEVLWHKNGRPVAVNYSVNPMMNHDAITGAVVAFTDVAERKQAEAAAAESARRLRFVMDSIPQKIFTATPDGRVDYLNPAWEYYSGYKPGELRQEWSRLIHPDELQESQQAWDRCVEHEDPFQLEHRFRDAHGEYRWHLTRARPMRDAAGQVIMWIGSNTDIHDIKKAELELTQNLASERRSVALLSDVAAAAHTISSVLSVDDIVRIITEQAHAILGVGRATTSVARGGDHFSITLDGAGQKVYRGKLSDSGLCAEVCRSGEPLQLTQAELEQNARWRTLQNECYGHLPVNGWLAVPMLGQGGKNIGLVQVSDKCEGEFTGEDQAILTQLAAIAAVGIDNASLYDSLREQDRRKDEFLATLAHELRNPLAPLRTGLDILQQSAVDERVSQVRDMMERQLGHMVRLVDDLMDVSRVSRGKVELKRVPVLLNDVVDIAVEAAVPLINTEGHQLSISIPEEKLYVHGDLTRLAQILSNLLSNAAKFTPRGGAIEIVVERVEDCAEIRVTDSGIGLSPEMLPRVFDLFTQVRSGAGELHGGLGIGLSLVQQLVGMHGGSVSADSAGLGGGSTFTVALPLIEAAEASEPGGTIKNVGTTPKRILVVDDNADAADALATLLEAAGHEVVVAYTGSEGVSASREVHPDLVLLDLGLPDMSGHEVAAALRKEKELEGVVLIAVTGWGNEEDRRRSRAAGFDLHLTKPVDANAIFGALARFS